MGYTLRCRLEVLGDRELKFFPGVARGAVLPGFDYQTETGAGAVHLTCHEFTEYQDAQYSAGQTAIADLEQHLAEQQAAAQSGERLASERPSATIDAACQHTDNRAASKASDSYTCSDYSNGGPCFELSDGANVTTLPGVQVLAR